MPQPDGPMTARNSPGATVKVYCDDQPLVTVRAGARFSDGRPVTADEVSRPPKFSSAPTSAIRSAVHAGTRSSFAAT